MNVNNLLGKLTIPLEEFVQKIHQIKAIVSDWDGVFNDGIKNPQIPSGYAEAYSMGTNLLRYTFWKKNAQMPLFAIITGATNPSAIDLAKREHFQYVYSKIVNKGEAILHFCEMNQIQPHEVACFFDDANDLAMAKVCGLRFFFQRKATPFFTNFVVENQLCDYITAHEGGEFAIREITEMMMGCLGNYQEILLSRANFDIPYQTYFELRQNLPTQIYKKGENGLEVDNSL